MLKRTLLSLILFIILAIPVYATDIAEGIIIVFTIMAGMGLLISIAAVVLGIYIIKKLNKKKKLWKIVTFWMEKTFKKRLVISGVLLLSTLLWAVITDPRFFMDISNVTNVFLYPFGSISGFGFALFPSMVLEFIYLYIIVSVLFWLAVKLKENIKFKSLKSGIIAVSIAVFYLLFAYFFISMVVSTAVPIGEEDVELTIEPLYVGQDVTIESHYERLKGNEITEAIFYKENAGEITIKNNLPILRYHIFRKIEFLAGSNYETAEYPIKMHPSAIFSENRKNDYVVMILPYSSKTINIKIEGDPSVSETTADTIMNGTSLTIKASFQDNVYGSYEDRLGFEKFFTLEIIK